MTVTCQFLAVPTHRIWLRTHSARPGPRK
jgi:hypothetical protein